jgi:hypothetical protein
MMRRKNTHMLLVGKSKGKRPLGKPRRRWVNNIKIDLGEVGLGGVDWVGMAEDKDNWRALVNVVSIKCWETVEWLCSWWPLN